MDLSIEIFPPKSPTQADALARELDALAAIRPNFVSVTCGAGGSTQERTHNLVSQLHRQGHWRVAAHLTCVGRRQTDVDAEALDYRSIGVNHIVALRGDPPAGTTRYVPTPGGYPYAVDLVEGLNGLGGFDLSVAAYPEAHPESAGPDADLDNLKRKIDGGANRAITQFCFETDRVFRFIDRIRAAGITVPVLIGVLPILDFAKAVNFAQGCGASVPAWLHERFDAAGDDPAQRRAVSLDVARSQCAALARGGVDGIHIYTLNRSGLPLEICRSLGWTLPSATTVADNRPRMATSG